MEKKDIRILLCRSIYWY